MEHLDDDLINTLFLSSRYLINHLEKLHFAHGMVTIHYWSELEIYINHFLSLAPGCSQNIVVTADEDDCLFAARIMRPEKDGEQRVIMLGDETLPLKRDSADLFLDVIGSYYMLNTENPHDILVTAQGVLKVGGVLGGCFFVISEDLGRYPSLPEKFRVLTSLEGWRKRLEGAGFSDIQFCKTKTIASSGLWFINKPEGSLITFYYFTAVKREAP